MVWVGWRSRAALAFPLAAGLAAGCTDRALQFGSGAVGDSEGTGTADDAGPPGAPSPGSGPMMTTATPPQPPGPMTTAPAPTTLPPDDPTDPTDPDPTLTSITVTESDTGSPNPPGELPNGAQCLDDEECASMECYEAGVLGGICGECDSDEDCPAGGCSPPNPIEMLPSVCNGGAPGDGCESDASCDEPFVCAEILDVPGVITASACSECLDDEMCDGELCNPFIDPLEFTGVKICVPPGTVPFGETCDFVMGGDFACQSGRCAVADFMGLLQIGVCSQCTSDADCFGGTCMPPEIDLPGGGILPGLCV